MISTVTKFERTAFIAFLVCSVSLNVSLAHRLKAWNEPATPAKAKGLFVGNSLKPLAVTDVNGSPIQISFNDGLPAVVYILSPFCSACAKNLANVVALGQHIKDRFRLVGLAGSAEGVADYVKTNSLPFPVYVATADTVDSLRLRTIPETVAFDSAGTVLQIWTGAFSGEVQKSVESFFGLTLPGLRGPGLSPAVASPGEGR